MVTNSTHKADLKSWVEAANEPMCSFSIQNLPYGVFNSNENLEKRIGVAIGDHVLDLNMIEKAVQRLRYYQIQMLYNAIID